MSSCQRREEVKYDKRKLPHSKKCDCNECLNAIISCYRLRVGQVVECERRKCVIQKILPPRFANTKKLWLWGVGQSYWCEWANPEEVEEIDFEGVTVPENRMRCNAP